MIYLDANIFIYAYFKAKRQKLPQKIIWMKEEAKKIIQMVNDGKEEFCISLIQLSEIVNLLKYFMSWEQLHSFLWGLISNNSIEILEISKMIYINSIDKIPKFEMDSNDISAYLLMKEKRIDRIYTFDKNFREIKDIICLPKIPDKFN